MTVGSTRSAWGDRLLLMCDAFLYAAAFDIVVSSIFMTIAIVTGFANTDVSPTSAFAIVTQVGFLLVTLIVIGAGALLAWRFHGRETRPMVIVAMIVGVAIGLPLSVAVFGSVAFLLSRVPLPIGAGENDPPWLAIGILGVLVAAMLAVPVVEAVRDLASKRVNVGQDWLRLASLGVLVALAVIVWPLVGGEAAEAGIFMVPFSAAAMLAVLAADLYSGFRDRSHGPEPAANV